MSIPPNARRRSSRSRKQALGWSKLVKTCQRKAESERVFADVQHEKGCIKMGYVYAPYDWKSTVKTVYVLLRANETQCRVSAHLAIGTKVDRKVRDKLDERTSITGFVSKTYFPQETI